MKDDVNLTFTEIDALIVRPFLILPFHFYFSNCPQEFITFFLKCGEGYKTRSNNIELENAQKAKLLPSEKKALNPFSV